MIIKFDDLLNKIDNFLYNYIKEKSTKPCKQDTPNKVQYFLN